MQKCVQENAYAALDQEDYLRRYGALLERYEAVKSGLTHIADQRQERSVKRESILQFLEPLEQGDLLADFDEALWYSRWIRWPSIPNMKLYSPSKMGRS